MVRPSCLVTLVLTVACGRSGELVSEQPPDAGSDGSHAAEPLVPPIPVAFDAYRQWDRWARLRIGVRASMRSTFDRAGGNEGADASHFLRQDADDRNVVMDVAGRGVLYFARANHWHGSPWHIGVDGEDHVVSESSTATPTQPVAGSVYLPTAAFPSPLALTWSTTRGADLSWVPIAFERSLGIAYGRTHYGTGYFIHHTLPDDEDLTQPLQAWNEEVPPTDVLELLGRAGEDIAPSGTAHEGTIDLAAGASRLVADLSGEPSEIRALAFHLARPDAEAFGRARLRITWDDRKAPSVDAPVALLFGTGSLYDRTGRGQLVKSLPASVTLGPSAADFALYFPMPFFERARIELVSDVAVPKVAWQIRTTPYTDPPAWVGYFHATYVDHGVPLAGRDLSVLDTKGIEDEPAWCGHFVGMSWIFSDAANLATLEGDPRFFFDDSATPQAQGTGTEEWGGGGDYWGGETMTLPLAGHPVGAPSPADVQSAEDAIESAYRFLLADLMPFGHRARIQLEHGGTDESTEHYRSVAYWYGRPRACTVLTDTLHVGDPTDERAHRYDSADASAVESLTSRYELGVDHLGAVEIDPATTDTGRHTSGTTEMTLAVDPNNLGVLLRRKLDLRFADQRAEVSIADDREGAPFVHAATWYTAGSNQVVYSNPPGELDPPQPTVQISNRRFREDEIVLPRSLTRGRSRIRVRITFAPAAKPLTPGGATPETAWSEFRYSAYSYVLE